MTLLRLLAAAQDRYYRHRDRKNPPLYCPHCNRRLTP